MTFVKSEKMGIEYNDDDMVSILTACSKMRGNGGYLLNRTLHEFSWFVNDILIFRSDNPDEMEKEALYYYEEWKKRYGEMIPDDVSNLLYWARAFVYYCDRVYLNAHRM